MRFVILFRDRVRVGSCGSITPMSKYRTRRNSFENNYQLCTFGNRENTGILKALVTFLEYHNCEGFEKDEWLPWVMNERNALSTVEYAGKSDIRPRYVQNDLNEGNKKTLLKGSKEI